MPATERNVIEIKNIVLGGISDSDYLGIENSVSKLVGFNIHGTPGLMVPNQALAKISGTTITELCKQGVYASNGEVYMFSAESGKIWRIKADDTVELCYTTAASAGESKCLGAIEYGSYIIWATQNKVHRILTTNAESEASWTTLDLNWQSFSVGDLEYHPMEIQSDVLYIGDGYEVATIDEAYTFTATGALNIQVKTGSHRISTMMNFTTSILFGTVSFATETVLALWNTWSTHITGKDTLPEEGANAFLKIDNYAVASVGKKGNFYSFGGNTADQIRRIPGDWSGAKEAKVYPGSNANRFGLPLFGVSNVNGNPCPQGIYSIGKYSAGYNSVLNFEYAISTGNVSNVEIGAIVLAGYDMYVSWKDTTTGTVCGVDKLDHSNKTDGAYFETRVIEMNPDEEKEFDIEAFYKSLPTDTDITFQYQKNYGSWSAVKTMTDDSRRLRKHNSIKIKAATVKFRIIATVNGNDAPEIRNARVLFD